MDCFKEMDKVVSGVIDFVYKLGNGEKEKVIVVRGVGYTDEDLAIINILSILEKFFGTEIRYQMSCWARFRARGKTGLEIKKFKKKSGIDNFVLKEEIKGFVRDNCEIEDVLGKIYREYYKKLK